MQETQQIEELQSEFISLSEFIPKWTYINLSVGNAVDQGKIREELDICISDGETCIIGEAHGGENYDDCDSCHFMSYGRKYTDKYDARRAVARAIAVEGHPSEFMKLKKELYTHMIDEHPQKMRR